MEINNVVGEKITEELKKDNYVYGLLRRTTRKNIMVQALWSGML